MTLRISVMAIRIEESGMVLILCDLLFESNFRNLQNVDLLKNHF